MDEHPKPRMIIQRHHIQYAVPEKRQPEIVVALRKEEHFYITRIGRFKYVSRGFLKALKHFIWMHEDSAIDLDEELRKLQEERNKKRKRAKENRL